MPMFPTIATSLFILARQRDITGTWLDAFNFLDLIPGFPFIFLFVLYSAGVLVLLRFLFPRFQALVEPAGILAYGDRIPLAHKPDYIELAFIRGGRRAVVETVLCNLYRLGLVDQYIKRSPGAPALAGRLKLVPLEYTILDACGSTAAHDIVNSREVRAAFADFERKRLPRLRDFRLVPGRATMMSFIVFFLLALLLIEGLAGIRLARSIMRGYSNVEFLVLLMFGVPPTAWLMLFPRTSAAGARYLQAIRDEYTDLIRRVQARLDSVRTADLVYALAACGTAPFGGTPYANIRRCLEPPPTSTSSGSCSGCGGGGCGGGGCGGGGCGGGGCGGG